MANHTVTRDPSDPTFPHGTTSGRRRGCDCQKCKDARFRAEKRQRMNRAAGLSALVPASPARDRLQELLQHPDVSLTVLAQCSGYSRAAITRVATGVSATISPEFDRILRAMTLEDALSLRAFRTGGRKRVIQQMYSMQAQGWPLSWQARRLGRSWSTLQDVLHGSSDRVTTAFAQKVDRLAAELDGKWGPSEVAKRNARQNGWYPLAAYDEDGDLIAGAVSMSEDDAIAEAVINALRLSVQGDSIQQVYEKTGVSHKDVRAYRAVTGLTKDRPGKEQGRIWVFTDPAAVERVREVCAKYEFEGWSAAKALAELGVHPKPLQKVGRPKKAA